MFGERKAALGAQGAETRLSEEITLTYDSFPPRATVTEAKRSSCVPHLHSDAFFSLFFSASLLTTEQNRQAPRNALKNSETQLIGFMSPGSTDWIFQKITMECSKRVRKMHTYWRHHLPLCHTFLCHKEKCYWFEVSGLSIKNTSDVFRCFRHFVLVHIRHFHPMFVCQTAKTCVKIFPSVLKLGSYCHLHTAVYKQSRITHALQPPEANKSTQEPDQAYLGFSVSCVHLPNNELQKNKYTTEKNNIIKSFFLISSMWAFTSFHRATFPFQTWNHLQSSTNNTTSLPLKNLFSYYFFWGNDAKCNLLHTLFLSLGLRAKRAQHQHDIHLNPLELQHRNISGAKVKQYLFS